MVGKIGRLEISPNSAWLSGFIDAEGCFTALQRSGRLTFRMRFSIRQKGEYEVFKQFWGFAGPGIKLGHLTLQGDIVTYTIDSLIQLRHLISYLEIHPLQSNKNIAYNK